MKRFTYFLFILSFSLCSCFAYNTYIASKYATTSSSTGTSFAGIQPTVIPFRGGSQRQFMFVNHTGQTIWVGTQGSILLNNGGWRLDAGQVNTISVPNGWSAGRFWGRTGCTFDSSGAGSCATGDCGGHLQCNGAGGATPASLAEFTLNGAGDNDFYDISYVDGFNVPMIITTSNTPSSPDSHQCGNAGCPTDINAICPSELQKNDAGGKVIACMSPCTAFHTDQYCCQGAYLDPKVCSDATSKWPIDYVSLVRKACPSAYAYAFDDATSTFACHNCNYQITFGSLGPS